MEDKFFDVDEAMIEYSEMTSFDFSSGSYLAISSEKDKLEFLKGLNFNILDVFKSLFTKIMVWGC